MRRIRINDLTELTGLSRSTVDRVLNGRGGVHPKSIEAVNRALHQLETPVPDTAVVPPFELILRLGRGTTEQLRRVFETEYAGDSTLHDMSQHPDQDLADMVNGLSGQRPIIIAAMNTPLLVDALSRARRKGTWVTALISDISPEARDVYVGLDNRAAGQTAAFILGKMLGDRPTAAGVVLGDPAFRCHEDREIGFRTALRQHFPKVVLAGEACGDDNRLKTRAQVLALLETQPAIAALYNVGGGNPGMVEAVKQAGRADDILIISHEVNNVMLPLLHKGSVDFVLAQDPSAILHVATDGFRHDRKTPPPIVSNLDFSIYTKFNFPGYARQQFISAASENPSAKSGLKR